MKIAFRRNKNRSGKSQNKIGLSTSRDLENLYVQSADKLFRVSYQLVGSIEVAESLVHNVFCDIWDRRETLDIKVPLEAYVVQSVKYESFRYLKDKVERKKNHKEVVSSTRTFHNDTEEQLQAQELKSRINTLIKTFPARCQAVFRMSREKFMSNKEIASELGISEKAVEKQMTKALKLLRVSVKEV